MPPFKLEIEAASVVLLGDFNPAILHPSWLVQQELIKDAEAENAEIQVVSPEVTSFSVEWLSIQSVKSRFSATSSDPAYHLVLKNLVVGIFTLLEFTPLRQMGINRGMHFQVEEEEAWHRLGDLYAPKDPWGGMLSGTRGQGIPGLRSLTMEGTREGSDAKYVQVKVEPSTQVPGVHVYTNEHYELQEGESSGRLIDILGSSWEDAQAFALEMAEHLLKGASN